MKQIVGTGLAALGYLAAMLLAAPQAQATITTEAEREAIRAGDALDAAAYGPGSYSKFDVCSRLRAAKDRLYGLGFASLAAGGRGDKLAAARMAGLADALGDLIWDVEEDFDCWPPFAFALPGGGGGGGGGWHGFYIGVQGTTIDSYLVSTEILALNQNQNQNFVTNRFVDRRDPFGVGVLLGYKFVPWGNVVVSPFVSFDYLNAPVNHNFPGGSFLGSTANVDGTFGVKVGPQFQMVWLYGIAGFSVLNETLRVNFVPAASSFNTTVPGETLGAGLAFQPNVLQGFGAPVSLFVEYQHTWWSDATFGMPAAAPLFNFNFARQENFIKFGVTVGFGGPPPAAPPLVAK